MKPQASNRNKADRVAGGIFIVMGIVAFVEGWRLIPMRARGVVGDDTFPLVLGVVMIILGAMLVFFPAPAKKAVTWPKGAQAALMLKGFIALALFWSLLKYIGFPMAGFIATAGLFYTIGSFRWYNALVYSAILTAIFYALFVVWLEMPFPRGIFGI